MTHSRDKKRSSTCIEKVSSFSFLCAWEWWAQSSGALGGGAGGTGRSPPPLWKKNVDCGAGKSSRLPPATFLCAPPPQIRPRRVTGQETRNVVVSWLQNGRMVPEIFLLLKKTCSRSSLYSSAAGLKKWPSGKGEEACKILGVESHPGYGAPYKSNVDQCQVPSLLSNCRSNPCKLLRALCGINGRSLGWNGRSLGWNGRFLGWNGRSLGWNGRSLGWNGRSLGWNGRFLGWNGRFLGWNGRSSLIVLRSGLKFNQDTYRDKCLVPFLENLLEGMDADSVILYQDKAPCHAGEDTQSFLAENVPCFIQNADIPSKSPDLKPLDFCVRSLLKQRVSRYGLISNFDRPAQILKAEWKVIPQKSIQNSVDPWMARAKRVEQAVGGHVEYFHIFFWISTKITYFTAVLDFPELKISLKKLIGSCPKTGGGEERNTITLYHKKLATSQKIVPFITKNRPLRKKLAILSQKIDHFAKNWPFYHKKLATLMGTIFWLNELKRKFYKQLECLSIKKIHWSLKLMGIISTNIHNHISVRKV